MSFELFAWGRFEQEQVKSHSARTKDTTWKKLFQMGLELRSTKNREEHFVDGPCFQEIITGSGKRLTLDRAESSFSSSPYRFEVTLEVG
jgi:hypothetical protein